VDANGDGKLDVDEFIALFENVSVACQGSLVMLSRTIAHAPPPPSLCPCLPSVCTCFCLQLYLEANQPLERLSSVKVNDDVSLEELVTATQQQKAQSQ